MFFYNFKTALNYLLKNRFYTILNLFGLVLGLAFSLIAYLIIYQEISYDRFHKDYREIYQVLKYEKKQTGTAINWNLAGETADILRKSIPEFTELTMIPSDNAPSLILNGMDLKAHGIYADSLFFKIFSFRLLKGNADEIFNDSKSIIISEDFAQRYFPGTDPVGQYLNVRGMPEKVLNIAGVFEDVPVRSSLQFDYLVPFQDYSSTGTEFMNVYVKMNSHFRSSDISEKIRTISLESEPEKSSELFLAPFYKLHVWPVRFRDAQAGGMVGAIIGLTTLGFLVLLIACINYMNLATALSIKRTKETGIRKILGTSRFRLSAQFMLESLLLSIMAMALAFLSARLIIPLFNRTFNWNLIVVINDRLMIAGLLVILLMTSLLSGSYPALYLSKLNPLQILKGSDSKGSKSSGLRKMLIITQFFFATVLVIISVSASKQIRYIKTKDIGVDINNMVMLTNCSKLIDNYQSVKDEMRHVPYVEDVTLTSCNPLIVLSESGNLDYTGKGNDEIKPFAFLGTDFDFVKTMGLKIKEGRNFDRQFSTDSSAFIINETAAKALGADVKTGSRIIFEGREGTIIGVVSDYHMTHMNFPIKPMILLCNKNLLTNFIIRFKPGMMNTGISEVKKIIKNFDNSGVTLTTMHDAFENIYSENVFRIGKISIIFSCLALCIACLGLISLSMYNAELRTKEVGIHRVHGADIKRIVKMLTAEYARYVVYSFLFAIPAGYLLVSKLFSRTAYHTNISVMIFLMAALFVFLTAVCTAGWQALRIALRNPAETLKYE